MSDLIALSETKSRRAGCVGLLVVLVAAGVIRFHRIGGEDYWLDEIHTLANSAARRGELESIPHGTVLEGVSRYTNLTADSTVASVWGGMVEDTHPPLYFVLVNIWRGWFGDSESAVRSLSAVASLVTIVIVAIASCVFRSSRGALLATIIMSLAYADVYAAQQARPYAWAMLFVIASSVLFLAQERSTAERGNAIGGGTAVAYAVGLLGAMLTHYLAALPLIAHVICGGVRFRGTKLVRWSLATALAALAWAVVWGPAFLDQRSTIANQPWLGEDTPDHFLRTLMRVTDLPMRLLFAYQPFSFSATRSIAGAGLLAVLVWILRPSKRADRSDGFGAVFVLMYAVPMVFLLATDLWGGRQMLAHLRYGYFAWPGLLGMIVESLDRLTPRARWMAIGTLVVGATLTLKLPTQNTPAARVAATVIEETAKPGDLLIYDGTDWPAHWASRLHAEISYYLPETDVPFVMLRDPPDEALLSKLSTFQRLIVVCPRPHEIPNPMPESFTPARDPFGYIDQIGWIYVLEHIQSKQP